MYNKNCGAESRGDRYNTPSTLNSTLFGGLLADSNPVCGLQCNSLSDANMKHCRILINVFLLTLLFHCLSVLAMSDDHDTKSSERPRPFDLQLKNNDDRATVTSHRTSTSKSETFPSEDTDAWSIDITCPRGIGRVVLKRRDERWPQSLRLRLKLKTMESIHCTICETHYEGFLEHRSMKTHWSRRTEEGNATELKPDSNEWSEIRITGTPEGQEASIPLAESQWIELKIPEAWLADNPDSIAFDWVDFHR